MSITPETSGFTAPDAGAPAPPPSGAPAPPPSDAPAVGAPPAQQGTNGLAVAGLILAFLFAPIGFILSLIGLVQAGKRGQKGKGLAIAGIIIAVLAMAAVGTVVVVIGQVVGDKAATLTDPGCTDGKKAILDGTAKLSAAPDPEAAKLALQTTIADINAAAAKSKNNEIRNRLKKVSDDFGQFVQAVNSGSAADPALQSKIETDAAAVVSLCTVDAK